MALAKNLKAIGIEAREALAIGVTFAEISAAGSSSSDATPIVETVNFVSGADGTKGVVLFRVGTALNNEVVLYNNSVSNLIVYSHSAENIYPPNATSITLAGSKVARFMGLESVALGKWIWLYQLGA